VATGTEVFDDGDQPDVQLARGELVGEPAGQVEAQVDLRRKLVEVVDERLGVEVVHRPNANGFDHDDLVRARSRAAIIRAVPEVSNAAETSPPEEEPQPRPGVHGK